MGPAKLRQPDRRTGAANAPAGRIARRARRRPAGLRKLRHRREGNPGRHGRRLIAGFSVPRVAFFLELSPKKRSERFSPRRTLSALKATPTRTTTPSRLL